jgi:hypothetical protein
MHVTIVTFCVATDMFQFDHYTMYHNKANIFVLCNFANIHYALNITWQTMFSVFAMLSKNITFLNLQARFARVTFWHRYENEIKRDKLSRDRNGIKTTVLVQEFIEIMQK